MRIRLWIMMVLLGLVLTGVGGVLTQISYRGPPEQTMMHDIKLERGKIFSIRLGLVDAGSLIEINYGSELHIDLTVVQTETGRPIEGMIGSTRGTVSRGSHPPMPGIFYELTEPLDLTIIVSITPEYILEHEPWYRPYNMTLLKFILAYIFPPKTYPYMTTGTGLAVGGIVVITVGVVARRKTKGALLIRRKLCSERKY